MREAIDPEKILQEERKKEVQRIFDFYKNSESIKLNLNTPGKAQASEAVEGFIRDVLEDIRYYDAVYGHTVEDAVRGIRELLVEDTPNLQNEKEMFLIRGYNPKVSITQLKLARLIVEELAKIYKLNKVSQKK